MNPMVLPMVLAGAGAASAMGLVVSQARRRSLDRWLPSYLEETARRRPPRAGEPVHLLLAIADHFEPGRDGVAPAVARARVDRWVQDYPRLFGALCDSDGRPPRHTFFYPIDEYQPEHLDALVPLCRAGYGEVEVHLHHDGDRPEQLRAQLLHFKDILAARHGLLPRHRDTGERAYGFVHGNWALDNARPDGRCCGVNNELDILRQTGCYADFTLPSAPSPTQTRKINSIYYATDDPHRPKSHDSGIDVGAGPAPPEALLLIQGPLLLDWSDRKWGILPHVENGCLQESQPPRIDRLDLWLTARVQVRTRPDWFFVKLYTHGAEDYNMRVLLDEPMVQFHQALARRAGEDPAFHYHYVTAREMVNLVRAAEAGWTGSVASARDYQLVWDH
ncbi:MAG TPA: hypothetical protein VFF52_16270 [Isosphaeraceae bacterium]|nr:hypothetical protein [Isosphaeraceae bacterium]